MKGKIHGCSFLLLAISFGLSGTACSSEPTARSRVDEGATSFAVEYRSPRIEKAGGTNQYTIYVAGSRRPSLGDGSIVWKGCVEGEYIIIDIVGMVKRISLIRLSWDGARLEEVEVEESESDVRDGRIIVDTYFTEGPPNEKIVVTDIDGGIFEYLIAEYDLAGGD